MIRAAHSSSALSSAAIAQLMALHAARISASTSTGRGTGSARTTNEPTPCRVSTRPSPEAMDLMPVSGDVVRDLLVNPEPDGIGHRLNAFDAGAGVRRGLVPLYLLLGDAQPFGERQLRQASGDPGLDEGGQKVQQRGHHDPGDFACSQCLKSPDLLAKVLDLTCQTLLHRLMDARLHTGCGVRCQGCGICLLERLELILGDLVLPFVGDHLNAPNIRRNRRAPPLL